MFQLKPDELDVRDVWNELAALWWLLWAHVARSFDNTELWLRWLSFYSWRRMRRRRIMDLALKELWPT